MLGYFIGVDGKTLSAEYMITPDAFEPIERVIFALAMAAVIWKVTRPWEKITDSDLEE